MADRCRNVGSWDLGRSGSRRPESKAIEEARRFRCGVHAFHRPSLEPVAKCFRNSRFHNNCFVGVDSASPQSEFLRLCFRLCTLVRRFGSHNELAKAVAGGAQGKFKLAFIKPCCVPSCIQHLCSSWGPLAALTCANAMNIAGPRHSLINQIGWTDCLVELRLQQAQRNFFRTVSALLSEPT
jgi:hypothetical protein